MTNTSNKQIYLPVVGGDIDLWGDELNSDFTIIDKALGGTLAKTITTATTLTSTEAQNTGFLISGTITGTTVLTWPAFFGPAFVKNSTTGGFNLSCGISGGTFVTARNGQTTSIWSNGTDFWRVAIGPTTAIVLPKTANYTLVADDSGTHFTNTGATGTVIFTLPTAVIGLTYTFSVQASQNVEILAPASTTIAIGGSISAAAGNLQSATPYTSMTLVCTSSTTWVSTGSSGAWTVT